MRGQHFQVQRQDRFEGALVYWWRDGKTAPITVRIPTRTFEDIFHRPRAADDERRRLTQAQCDLLAVSNLGQLGRVIEQVHAEATAKKRDERRLEVHAADIEHSGERLSDSVLDADANSGWAGRDGVVRR